MATDGVEETLAKLVHKMQDEYTASEYDIALALASADGPLTIEALADETGYTERTIKKRVGTLEDQLGGPPLLQRDEDDRPFLHPELAAVMRSEAEA